MVPRPLKIRPLQRLNDIPLLYSSDKFCGSRGYGPSLAHFHSHSPITSLIHELERALFTTPQTILLTFTLHPRTHPLSLDCCRYAKLYNISDRHFITSLINTGATPEICKRCQIR